MYDDDYADDKYDDNEYDDEYPDDPDANDLDANDLDGEYAETVPCPHCGHDVYEDAVQCPACGDYITHHATVWSGRPVWWIALGLLGIAAAVLTLARIAAW